MTWFTCPNPDDYALLLPVECPICHNHVANVRMRDLTLPIRGGMFLSPDVAHGFEAPFPSDATWEFCLCPWGGRRHRGVVNETTILIRGYGPYEIQPRKGVVPDGEGEQERRQEGREEGRQEGGGEVLMIPHKRGNPTRKRRAG